MGGRPAAIIIGAAVMTGAAPNDTAVGMPDIFGKAILGASDIGGATATWPGKAICRLVTGATDTIGTPVAAATECEFAEEWCVIEYFGILALRSSYKIKKIREISYYYQKAFQLCLKITY